MRNGLIGRAAALVFAWTVVAVGCSSDGGDEEEACGNEITALCGSTALNTLTQEQSLQLCTDTGAYVSSSVSRANGCKYLAIVAAASNSSPTVAELQNACTGREGSCNQDTSTPGAGALTSCSQVPMTCTATVEQFSTCIKEAATAFDQQAAQLVSCSTLTFDNLVGVYDVPTRAVATPGCMALKTACPNYTLPYIN